MFDDATLAAVEAVYVTLFAGLSGVAAATAEPDLNGLDASPAIVMWLENVEQAEPDEQEGPVAPVGKYAYRVVWETTLYLRADSDTPANLQVAGKKILGLMLGAVNASPTTQVASGVQIRESRIVAARPDLVNIATGPGTSLRCLVYVCEQHALVVA